MLFRSIFKDKKEKLKFSECRTTISEQGKNLNFEFECTTSSKETIKLVGKISTKYIARWGQIGSESEEEFYLKVFNYNPSLLQNIVAELYFENPSAFPKTKTGLPVIQLSQSMLKKRGIHAD